MKVLSLKEFLLKYTVAKEILKHMNTEDMSFSQIYGEMGKSTLGIPLLRVLEPLKEPIAFKTQGMIRTHKHTENSSRGDIYFEFYWALRGSYNIIIVKGNRLYSVEGYLKGTKLGKSLYNLNR